MRTKINRNLKRQSSRSIPKNNVEITLYRFSFAPLNQVCLLMFGIYGNRAQRNFKVTKHLLIEDSWAPNSTAEISNFEDFIFIFLISLMFSLRATFQGTFTHSRFSRVFNIYTLHLLRFSRIFYVFLEARINRFRLASYCRALGGVWNFSHFKTCKCVISSLGVWHLWMICVCCFKIDVLKRKEEFCE